MSALWRISLLVSLFFSLVAAVCLAVLLRQASQDVGRELAAAGAVLSYLGDIAKRDPAALQPELTRHLRHVQVRWLGPGVPSREIRPQRSTLLETLLYPAQLPAPLTVQMPEGRTLQLSVDPRDEIEEVEDSLLQLLVWFGSALLLSLLAIRWAVRPALGTLNELLAAFGQVSQGRLDTRLPSHSLLEAQRLSGHFNRMVSALEYTRRENDDLTRSLLELQERERTQLAQALHDDLGQYLAGIRAQACLLQAIKDQPQLVSATARSLDDHCEQLQDGFRRLTRELYPVMLDHLELPEAIRLLAEQWQSAQGIEVRVQIDRRIPCLALHEKEQLYRLLQESLTNVAKHACASFVLIRLRMTSGRLKLLVRDNGSSSSASGRPGIGLRSMHERARALEGRLIASGRSGQGWVVYLDIPIRESCSNEDPSR
ncbi:sensor histidine kinase [Stutzerimonas xanthomarina]|uniref:histidine kinase n=2 Tax=Stutzerimonas xanthomarina TaxID=271420 RepID=A0A1M5MM40_9GAMM|nr:histidine kinase [Stutzerimonas xanthomarina]MCP9337564.1 histidine kinase [Stutzerimonas xanthomarina]SEH88323.1 two-component system, NarL family, sensor histidine kinase UhpB [Stutzerimonas xanthomarina]SHG78306.1 two-component system, NarL family, sensor histidine kinase UhpB [Stutzerimonas xanthomarina DSM 18231]